MVRRLTAACPSQRSGRRFRAIGATGPRHEFLCRVETPGRGSQEMEPSAPARPLIAVRRRVDGLFGVTPRNPCPAQAVDATQALKRSAGVSNPGVCLGCPLRRRANVSRCSCECTDKSVPTGKYRRNNPFVFSFEPRCQGLLGRRNWRAQAWTRS